MKDINSFAMLSIHAEQTQVWAESILREVKDKTMTINKATVKADLVALFKLLKRFNGSIKEKLHEDTPPNVSKICQILATANECDSDRLLAAIAFLAKNAEVVFTQEKLDKDLLEKLTLISEMNDKLICFDIKELKKLHKKIINTPTNEKL